MAIRTLLRKALSALGWRGQIQSADAVQLEPTVSRFDPVKFNNHPIYRAEIGATAESGRSVEFRIANAKLDGLVLFPLQMAMVGGPKIGFLDFPNVDLPRRGTITFYEVGMPKDRFTLFFALEVEVSEVVLQIGYVVGEEGQAVQRMPVVLSLR